MLRDLLASVPLKQRLRGYNNKSYQIIFYLKLELTALLMLIRCAGRIPSLLYWLQHTRCKICKVCNYHGTTKQNRYTFWEWIQKPETLDSLRDTNHLSSNFIRTTSNYHILSEYTMKSSHNPLTIRQSSKDLWHLYNNLFARHGRPPRPIDVSNNTVIWRGWWRSRRLFVVVDPSNQMLLEISAVLR